MEVRITPLYDPQRGSLQHLLIGFFAEHATMLTQGLGVAKLRGSDELNIAGPPECSGSSSEG